MGMNKMQLRFMTGLGAIGAFVANMLGGWSTSLETLAIFIALDLITGWIVAGVFNKSSKTPHGALESRIGFKGVCKKGMMLMFILIAHRLDLTAGTDYFRTGTIIAWIGVEFISLVENADAMGLPVPSILTGAIEVLKNKYEGGINK